MRRNGTRLVSPRRRKRSISALLLVGGALAAAAATAAPTPCTLDREPAATLLLPYFEVDLADTGGRTTLMSIDNSTPVARVVNVTLWTDLGVPTLHFNLYLTGFDVQTINLRDLFAGRLPGTAPAGQDATDTISPKGSYSQDVEVPSCAGLLPPSALDASLLEALRSAHTGGDSPLFGGCTGQRLDGRVARGYVTADVVRGCTVATPADSGYFVAGGQGVAIDENVLWGDWMLVDPSGNSAAGDELVRVQAFPGRFHSGESTFYGSFVGHSAADDREPLPHVWATRFLQRGAFSGGTDLLVWRDPATPTHAFDCTSGPSWYPLAATVVPWDEQENPQLSAACYFDPCPPLQVATPFPAAANRVAIAEAGLVPEWYGPPLPTPFDFGWLDLLLADSAHPYQQAWVGPLMRASGRYAVGLAATPLDSGCDQPLSSIPFAATQGER